MSLALAAAAVALAELDATQVGQLAFSRPLVLAPLLGAALGRWDLGLALGATCELFSLRELPVGGRLPLNATVAAGGALLLACGGTPPPLALPAGMVLGWVHRHGEGFLRRRRDALGPEVEARLRRGDTPGLGCRALLSLAQQAAWTLGLLGAALAARGLLHGAWDAAPGAFQDGAALAWMLSPWLGLAALGQALLWERRSAA